MGDSWPGARSWWLSRRISAATTLRYRRAATRSADWRSVRKVLWSALVTFTEVLRVFPS
jgi:hypothetical protein